MAERETNVPQLHDIFKIQFIYKYGSLFQNFCLKGLFENLF